MISVKVDRSDPLALHDQVAAEIRRAIAEGEAGPGDRLPLAKDLAAVLGVNKNTVLRALHLLHDEGLLDFQPRPRHHRVGHAAAWRRGEAGGDLIDFCRQQGYQRDEVIRIIESLP